MKEKLEEAAIASRLADLPGWRRQGDAIRRTVELPSFRAALAFVAYVGELAEAAGHHPDLDIRYSRVELTLTTHDAGGLTESDFDLARQIG